MTIIGHLRLLDWPDGEAPTVGDLEPPQLGEREILVVRRLDVVGPPAELTAAIGGEVEAALGLAARPTGGRLPHDASAVLFRDDDEMLAAFTVAGIDGVAGDQWWWVQLGLTSPVVSELVASHRPIVPIIDLVERWGFGPEVSAGFSPSESMAVLRAIAAQHRLDIDIGAGVAPEATEDPGGAERPHGRRDQVGTDPRQHRSPETVTVGRFGRPMVRGTLGSDGAGRLLRDVVAALAHPAARRPSPQLAEHGPARRAGPTVAEPAASDDLSTPEAPPHNSPNRQVRFRPDATTDPAPPASPDGLASTAPPPAEPTPAADPAEVRPPTPREPTGRGATVDELPPTVAGPPHHLDPTEPALPVRLATRYAGTLYLAQPFLDLDVDVVVDVGTGIDLRSDQDGGTSPAGAPWALFDALVRGVLRRVEPDPIWDLFADLAGRRPEESPTSQALAMGRRLVAPLLDQTRMELQPLRHAVLVPGHLEVTPAELTVHLPLVAIDLEIRRRGMDADPGWVPALGRIIRFEFSGRGHS